MHTVALAGGEEATVIGRVYERIRVRGLFSLFLLGLAPVPWPGPLFSTTHITLSCLSVYGIETKLKKQTRRLNPLLNCFFAIVHYIRKHSYKQCRFGNIGIAKLTTMEVVGNIKLSTIMTFAVAVSAS